eukprot:SAG31_NODE_9731_length_1236_cov_0.838171_2_plen_224_part_00
MEDKKISVFETGSLFGEAEGLQSMLNDDRDPSTYDPIVRSSSAKAIAQDNGRPTVTEVGMLPLAEMAALCVSDPAFRETLLSFAARRAAKYGIQLPEGKTDQPTPRVRPIGTSTFASSSLKDRSAVSVEAVLNTAESLGRAGKVGDATFTNSRDDGPKADSVDISTGDRVGHINGDHSVHAHHAEVKRALAQQKVMARQQEQIAEALRTLSAAVRARSSLHQG